LQWRLDGLKDRSFYCNLVLIADLGVLGGLGSHS
jgi:hypothetical protein